MEDDSGKSPEVTRLRALGAWMRDVGALELSLGDLHIKLAPRAPANPPRAAVDPDEQSALSAEEKSANEENDAEAAYYAFWRRLTRSSGAPIPPYSRPKKTPPAGATQ